MSRDGMHPFRAIRRRQFIQLCAGSLAAVGCAPRGDQARAKLSAITVLSCCDERLLGPLGDDPPKFLVFLPVVTRNAHGELEGCLAQSWEHSPDYRAWTVHLRKDLRWHDGVPVTAHDVKFTLDLFMHPAVLWVPLGAYAVAVLDDRTYTITYTYHGRVSSGRGLAGSPGEDDYTVYWPKHLLDKLDPKDLNNWDFWTHPVGNGPYRYVRHVPKTMMELEANPDYYRGKPKIERVVLKFGDPSGPGAVTELVSGNVDMAVDINRMYLLKLRGDPRFRVYDAPYSGSSGTDAVILILWNQRHAPFRDPKVRRALTLAINRRELHQVLNLSEETPTFDVIFTERQFRRDEFPEPLPYDPELAKKLLDEAGWHGQNGEGLRQRGGRPFRFAALATPYQGEDKAAVYIQAGLRRMGIQMDVTVVEWEANRKRVMAGEFEAAIPPVFGGGDYLRVLSGESETGDRPGVQGSPIGYVNPKVTTLLKEARDTLNPDEQDRIYRALWPIFQADLPMTFLYPYLVTAVATRRVRGLSSPWRANPVEHMEDVWLEEEGR